MAFTVDIRGNASHLEKTLKSVKGSIASLGSVAKTGVAGLAGLGAAGAAGLTAFVVSSSKAAANIEVMTMQFATLLGGADAAGKRMKEIIDFAASTPFEIPELVATSKLLQTLGGTMLATGEGLRMVGDAAAISGQPLEEVGRHIGRVFNAITTGNSAGESVARLQELGLIGGDVKREFEDLAAAQKKGTVASLTGAQAMAKLKAIFKQTEGAMIALSTTTSGKLSNMKDNMGKLQVAFGTGFNDGLKVALDATNNFLPQIESKFKDAGLFLGIAIQEAVDGDLNKFALIGEIIGTALGAGLKIGFKKAILGAVEGAIVDYVDYFQSANYAGRMEQKNKFMDLAMNETDPEKKQKFIDAANYISTDQPKFRENYNIGNAARGSMTDQFAQELAPVIDRLNAEIQNAKSSEIARKLGQGFNQNLTKPMANIFSRQGMNYSDPKNSAIKPETLENAVTQGVLKAFVKQAPGAKFSN